MYLFLSVVFVVVSIDVAMSGGGYGNEDEFLQKRYLMKKTEKTRSVGGNIKLTSKEIETNAVILSAKKRELEKAYKNESEFLPSQHFFQAKNKIQQSEVFEIIKKLPKGCSLHTHMLAGVSVDFIMSNIMSRSNIYGCFINDTFKLRFLQDKLNDSKCEWKSLEDYRKEDKNFDKWLRTQLTLEVEDPAHVYQSAESVWHDFKKIFTTLYDLISYRPVFELYITELLEELVNDNVMYIELRGTFMPLYELDGTVYDTKQFFEFFINTVDKFKADNPKFFGARYIHSIYRGVTPEVLKTGLHELLELQKQFPEFIIGFDFVGYEEDGHQLVDYHQELLEVSDKLNFFFHAGETNWYGHTDLNLIDAVLLNTSRIGHGFALPKHPVVMETVKAQKIAVEICPISNQVLMLHRDPRNHPAISLISNGFPVVICNDDPAVWGATGLSYDWYVVFLAMTSSDAGIETLKQLAFNSISYSGMTDQNKSKAIEIWTEDWKKFVDDLLAIK